MASSGKEQVQYAGFWVRFVAYTIDILIFIAPLFIIDYFIVGVLHNITGHDISHMSGFASFSSESWDVAISHKDANLHTVAYIIQCAVFVLIYRFFLVSNWQATPGKRLMNMYVVDVEGNILTSNKAILRTALPLIFLVLFVNYSNHLMADFDEKMKMPDNKIIDVVEESMPETYKIYSTEGADVVLFYENLSVASSLSSQLGVGNITVNEIMLGLKSYGALYTEEDMKDIEIMLNEFEKLSEDKRQKISDIVGVQSLDVMADAMKTFGLYLFFIAIFSVWYLMAAFTKQKTTIHDLIAKTRVIKGRP